MEKTTTKTDKSKLLKIAALASLIAAAAGFLVIVLYNFLPVLSIFVEGNDKFDPARIYVGWQIIYYCFGIQIIYGYHEFGTNIVLVLASVLPALGLIILTLTGRKGGKVKRAVCDFLAAALMMFAAVAFMNALTLCQNSVSPNIEEWLLAAKDAGTYTLQAYPIAAFVLLLISAIVKAACGAARLVFDAPRAENQTASEMNA